MTKVPPDRGVSPVLGTILMVAVVVVIAATVGVTALGYADTVTDITGEMTYGENRIGNPGFEDGGARWVEYGPDGEWIEISDGKVADGEGVDGTDALRLTRNQYVEQDLDAVLFPDAEYRLCASTRLVSEDGGRAYVGVQHADGGPENHLAVWEVTSDQYRTECKYFKADKELRNITVWAFTSDDGAVSMRADEFVLQRTRYLTDNARGQQAVYAQESVPRARLAVSDPAASAA